MSYVFSTSAGFASNDNITLINNDVSAQISTVLLDIAAMGDSIVFTFESPLNDTNKALLATIVKTYDTYEPPILVPAYLEINSTVLKHTINGVPTKYIGQQSNEIHVSTEQQGNYTSLKEAIAANSGPNHVFIIHPGEYHEDNPIVLDTGTVVFANGNAENTIIIANNPNADILHPGIKNKIEGITFRGATGTGCRGIYFNAAQSGGQGLFTAIFECFIKDCNIGLEINAQNIQNFGGIPDVLYARELVVTPITTPMAKAFHVHGGGQLISSGLSVYGIPPNPAAPAGIPIMDAYCGSGSGSKLAMNLSNCYFCVNGLYLNNNCQSEMTLLTLKYNYNGIVIGPDGDSTRLSVSSLEVGHSQNKDMSFYPQNAIIEVHSGVLDDTKIYNPNKVRLNMIYHSTNNGQGRQHLLGVINVGNTDEPASMLIGEGSYDNDICVLTNTDNESGTWNNLTSIASEETNTTPFDLFAGITVGNCLYFGRGKNVLGIKIKITTATTSITPSNSFIWEYWNGSTWIHITIMQTKDVAPYYYVQNSFISENNVYHIRFGIKSNDPLVTKTINGMSKRWVRMRIVTELPSMPRSEYVKFHTNCYKINGDGFTEYFGDSRTIKKLTWGINSFNSNTTTDQTVYYSKTMRANLKKNKFASNILSTISICTFIPTDIDNSFPIKIKFSLIGDSNTPGNVKLTFRYDFSDEDSALYINENDAPLSTPNEIVKSFIIPITAHNKEHRAECIIDLSGIDANLYSGGPQMCWISIDRDAGVGDDTYVGNIALIQIAPFYISWIDGGHLLGY